MTPTQRTLALLRRCGYRAQVVEKIIPVIFIRKDLFGVIDILAMKTGEPILAVQTCRTSDLSDRFAKHPDIVEQWLSTGNALEFWGWSKRGERGKRKLWALTRLRCGAGQKTERLIHRYEDVSKFKYLPTTVSATDRAAIEREIVQPPIPLERPAEYSRPPQESPVA